MPIPTSPESDLGRDWLVRLRWGVVVGQVATVLFAKLALGFPLPLVAAMGIGGIVSATAASNVLLHRTAHPAAIHATFILDLVLLTAVLALSGGASNPFSVLFLLHIALAAVLLGPAWTGGVTLLAVTGFGSLFAFTNPHAMHSAGAGAMRAHLWGMWLAFAVTGAGISWFVARLASALRQREAELTRLHRIMENRERVLSLATLAAGAAHELGSPLAAIAVSAREIELLAPPGSELAEEARAQRQQIDRCRGIIQRLTQRAGAGQSEPHEASPIGALWDDLGAMLAPQNAARVVYSAPPEATVYAPAGGLLEALGSLIENALKAGPGRVQVGATAEPGWVVLSVTDEGEGMPEDVLSRVGEPFFTTRSVGNGMGLGLFLARRFAEGLGGSLEVSSRPGRGTCARMRLPQSAA